MGIWVSLFNYLSNYRGDIMILLLGYGISNQSVEKILINKKLEYKKLELDSSNIESEEFELENQNFDSEYL